MTTRPSISPGAGPGTARGPVHPEAGKRRAGKHARIWLLLLLSLAGVVSGTVLYAKFRLESLRTAVRQTAETRTGAQFLSGTVSVQGIRGFSISDVDVIFSPSPGMSVRARIPKLLILIDLMSALYGDLAVEQVELDRAEFEVSGWETGRGAGHAASRAGRTASWLTQFPNAVSGKRCKVLLLKGKGVTPHALDDLTFSLSKAGPTGTLLGNVSAKWVAAESREISADFEFASPDRFEARASASAFRLSELSEFAPFLGEGSFDALVKPHVAIGSSAQGGLDISLETPYSQLSLSGPYGTYGGQLPENGQITVLATYRPEDKQVILRTGRLETESVQAEVSGSVSLGQEPPVLDVRGQARNLPLSQLVREVLGDRFADQARHELTLHGTNEMSFAVSGRSPELRIQCDASLEGADLSVRPHQKTWPRGSIRLGRMEAHWDLMASPGMEAGKAFLPKRLQVTVLDGEIRHEDSGFAGAGLRGTAELSEGVVRIEPLNMQVNGEPFVTSVTFDIEKRTGAANVSGTLRAIEETRLRTPSKRTKLAGNARIDAKAVLSPSQITLDGEVDLTQSDVSFSWWLTKPAGIGASNTVHVEIIPKKSILARIESVLGDSVISSEVESVYTGARFRMQSSKSTCSTLDIVTAGKCLNLPYVFTGTQATDCHYEWHRTDPARDDWHATAGGKSDELQALPQGGDRPFRLREAVVEAELLSADAREGTIELSVEEAQTPAFGSTWFVPTGQDDDEEDNWAWTYHLSASKLAVPPWEGTDFSGEAFFSPEEAGVHSYEATVDGGTIRGTYAQDRNTHVYTATNEWTGVPAKYFIEHLNMSNVLSGNVDGQAAWSQDRDNPLTLKGRGRFDVREGRFNADYIISQLEQIEGEGALLPVSLRFSHLGSSIRFEKDVIETPDLQIESEGVVLSGSGRFVRDGDMDYDIRVSVTPEVAERIPTLRESMNVRGHQLAQQNIELAFRVVGPTLRPRSELAGVPPVRVTLMTGALELTDAALQVIDTPRKILVDLLKIGGGIVAPRKPE